MLIQFEQQNNVNIEEDKILCEKMAQFPSN